MDNIFDVPEETRPEGASERFDPILTGSRGLLVERIVSHGHVTPEGTWYDQERDEWVMVLEGEATLSYEDGSELSLRKGDHVFLPKRVRHKVTRTSSPCIWLAVHGDELRPDTQNKKF